MKAIINEPKNYITPVIDGRVTSFFEWVDSGYIDNTGSSMQSNSIVKRIYFGEDKENLYFRLDVSDIDIDVKIFFDEDEVQPLKVAKDEIIEIKIKKPIKKEFEVRFEIYKNEKLIEIAPNSARLIMKINKDYSRNWFI